MYDYKQCIKCKYASHFNGVISCDYILMELERRGCYEGEVCEKFKPRKQKFSTKFSRGLLSVGLAGRHPIIGDL